MLVLWERNAAYLMRCTGTNSHIGPYMHWGTGPNWPLGADALPAGPAFTGSRIIMKTFTRNDVQKSS
jgi:hypothetical protein